MHACEPANYKFVLIMFEELYSAAKCKRVNMSECP
jgi:hypothetical protein